MPPEQYGGRKRIKAQDMNKRTMILSLAAMAVMQASAQRLTVEKETVDCGSVAYDAPVTAVFELRNKGGRRLKITDVRTSCGCVGVEYPRGEVAGGETFKLRLTYDARQLGRFYKQAAVYSSGSDEPLYLTMRGVVLAEVADYTGAYPFVFGDLRANRNELEFDDVNKGDKPELQIHIRNTGTETLRPNIMHLPPYLSAAVTPEKLRPGHEGRISITLNSDRLHDYGLTQTSVYLANKPGDKVSQDNEIQVSSVLLPGFEGMTDEVRKYAPKMVISADSLLFDFEGKKKKKGEIKITNTGRSKLRIRSLQMFTGGLKVTLGKRELDTGESTTLKVTAYSEELSKTHTRPRVLMITNDSDHPKVVVRIKTK